VIQRFQRVKLFVLGSTGFIGQRFVGVAPEGFEIVSEIDPANPAFVDLTRYETMLRWLDDLRPDAVLNLAGKSYHTAANDADIYESNVLVELNLHEAIDALKLSPTVVVASSSAVYRGSAEPVDEDASCLPAGTYGRAKYVQERVGLSYRPRQRVIVARLFNVIGPRQSRDFFLPAVIERLVRFKNGETKEVALKTLEATRDFIYVDDACRALAAIVARGADGEIYNVCSGKGTSVGEAIEILRGVFGLARVPLAPRDDSVKEGVARQIGSNRKLRGLGWSPSFDIERAIETIVREEYGI
jgi:nucleoside-diphosphate-sugar epimerase